VAAIRLRAKAQVIRISGRPQDTSSEQGTQLVVRKVLVFIGDSEVLMLPSVDKSTMVPHRIALAMVEVLLPFTFTNQLFLTEAPTHGSYDIAQLSFVGWWRPC
jgi:hypothetical protein